MNKSALLVSQSGEITHGLPALVSAHGYESVATTVTDRPEDGQYYLSPETLEQIEHQRSEVDCEPLALVVDGTLHPGQIVDLKTRLPSVTVRDRRGVVWDRLGDANPVAAVRSELYQSRVARREAASRQREEATQSPSGTSGPLAACDQQIAALRARLERRQEMARQRVETSYSGVDGRILLLGRVDAPTTALWSVLTGETAPEEAGRPAQPTTTTAAVGPHTVAVTDTPGVPGSGGLPDWMLAAVPGIQPALEQATCVLGVGNHRESLLTAVAERFGVTCRPLESATASAARDTLRDLLATTEYAVQLPYGDATQTLVSRFHDEAVVHSTEYGDSISLHVELALGAVDGWRRRTSAVGGEIQQLTEGG